MTRSRDQLERDLRAAAHDFDEVAASPSAWQDNQERLGLARGSRRSRLLGLAAGVAVLAVVAAAIVQGSGPSDGPPAGAGQDDPFATAYLLGEPVELETVPINSGPVVHEAALSDMTGDGPRLCDRYVGVTDSPICVDRATSADDPKVAVDWLTAYGPESPRRGVVVGLDWRVSSLAVWLTDGTRVDPPLRDGGWEQSRIAGMTVPAGDPGPQRLVAYGRGGTVLQSVDLVTRFGDGWVEQHSACAKDPVAELTGEEGVYPQVLLGTADAAVTTRLPQGDIATVCLRRLRGTAIAGEASVGTLAVAVLAAETELVKVRVDSRSVAELEPMPVQGTPWRVALVSGLSATDLTRAALVAYDLHGQELDRAYLSQPQTP